jgi:hypothetical protein
MDLLLILSYYLLVFHLFLVLYCSLMFQTYCPLVFQLTPYGLLLFPFSHEAVPPPIYKRLPVEH